MQLILNNFTKTAIQNGVLKDINSNKLFGQWCEDYRPLEGRG